MRVNRTLLKFAAVALSLAPLALVAYLGQFARLISDDYRDIYLGNKLGPIGSTVYRYSVWSASYTDSFVTGLMAPLDIVAVRVMPALFLSVWLLGILWLMCQGMTILQMRKHVTAISLGLSALTLAAIVNAFYSPQNLYWFAASTDYSLGLSLFTIYIAMVIWIARSQLQGRALLLAVAVSGLMSFLSAGCAEMHAVAQAIIHTLLLCFVVLQFRSTVRRRLFVIFGIGWLLTVCGLIVQAISPGVALRSVEVVRAYGMPSRDLIFLLNETFKEFLRRIQNPDAFAGFTMLMALGCLITSRCYPSQRESKTVHPVRITAIELLIPLAWQLTFLPLLWSHTSDSGVFLGRFSPSYVVIILANLALILGLSLMLERRKAVNNHLRRFHTATLVATNVLLFALICAFVLVFTHVIDIVDLAELYLVASALIMLAILGRKLLVAGRPLSARQLGLQAVFLLLVALACLAGLVFVAIYGQGYLPSRILEPVASLLVFPGLIWGAFMGSVLRMSEGSSFGGRVAQTLLRIACVSIVIAVGLGMFLGNAALIPDFQTYASEWDARHQRIITMRDAGHSVVEISPLTYSLDNYVGKWPLGKSLLTLWAEKYYGVDEIIVKGD